MNGDFEPPVVPRALTDFELFRLARDLRDDLASPADARVMLEQFVHGCYTSAGPSREALAFVRNALSEHLRTGKSLESAFRLRKGRKGRPGADEHKQHDMAAEVSRLRRIEGKTFENAVEEVALTFNASRTVVCRACARHDIQSKIIRGK